MELDIGRRHTGRVLRVEGEVRGRFSSLALAQCARRSMIPLSSRWADVREIG